MDTDRISQWILLSIIWGIILPYVIWTLYIYIKYKRHLVYFRKRKPFLIHLVLGLVLSGIFIENQLLIFLSMYRASDSLFAKCLRFVNMSSMIGIYMIIIERIYLLYFQYQYNEATISAKWKEYVNEEHEDFFLSNIHTYGDDKFLFRLTAIIWVIFACIYIILEQFIPSTSYSSWFIFILFFVLFIFAIYIWRKFPDFHDTLYIRKELQYFVTLNFLVLFIWTILLAISDSDSKMIIREYLQVVMYTVIFEISIHRVIKWNEIKMDIINQNDAYCKQMNDRAFGLKQVVESSNGYEQFMKFLVSEFATENLLFVTEYVQLKGILSLSEKEMKSLKLTFDLSLPLDIPIPKIIQDLNLDLEQIKSNQQYRKSKQLKREKEKFQRQVKNKAKLMQEIKMSNSQKSKKPTKTEQNLIEEVKQTEIEQYTVSLASPNSNSVYSSNLNTGLIEEEAYIQIETEPTPTVSPKETTDMIENESNVFPKVTTPTTIDVICEDKATSTINTNKQDKLPSINTSLPYDNDTRSDENTTPTIPSTNSNQLMTNYSRESTVLTTVIDNKQNEADLYGVPLENDEDDIVILRIKSLTNTNSNSKPPNQKPPFYTKNTKSLSDVNSIKLDIENEQKQKKSESLSPKSPKTSEKQSFLEEIMKQKTTPRKQSDPRYNNLNVNENDFNKIPSLSNNSRYSKDDMNMIETIKLKDGKPKKQTRHQSLSLRNSNDKHNKQTESVTSVRLQIVSSRLKSQKQLLSHHIRQKSKKMKSKMSYHMREASQSMALKMNYKKNDKFNVLNTKSFSILCTKLYYKYIATGVAPLEVNISSATRVRCDGIFRTQQRQRLPNGGRHSSLKGNKRGRTISSGVVSLLSRGNSLKKRNNAMDILRNQDGQVMRSKSKKKLTMMNSEEPFDGDIVRAMSQLLPPLEQCAVELTNLLKDSLSRFKKTQTCAKLYEEYVERKKTEQVVNEAEKKRNSKGTI